MVWFYQATFGFGATHIVFFQSHYGLILSWMKRSTTLRKEGTFNPTMVWFYRFGASNARLYMFDFQSHYGLILSLERVVDG